MRRILVVDDDPHVGRAIQGWLRDHGFRIQLADSSGPRMVDRSFVPAPLAADG